MLCVYVGMYVLAYARIFAHMCILWCIYTNSDIIITDNLKSLISCGYYGAEISWQCC